MDIVDQIMAYESGEMDEYEDIIEFFDTLVKTGIIRGLQGSYQRTAATLLEEGIIPL